MIRKCTFSNSKSGQVYKKINIKERERERENGVVLNENITICRSR